MPVWLAITIGVCSVTLTIVTLLVKTGMWAGRTEAQAAHPKGGNGLLAQHVAIMNELSEIREDTKQIRVMNHNLINAFAGVQMVVDLLKDDVQRRRDR